MMEHVEFQVVGGVAHYDGRTLAEWLPSMVGDIVRALDPDQVILFGSLARGDDAAHSDVDLIVVVAGATPGTRVPLALRARAAIRAPVPMDILILTPTELAERAEVPGTIRKALREGRTLHARPA